MLRTEEVHFRPCCPRRIVFCSGVESVFERLAGGRLVGGEAEPASQIPLAQIGLRESIKTLQKIRLGFEAQDRAIGLPLDR